MSYEQDTDTITKRAAVFGRLAAVGGNSGRVLDGRVCPNQTKVDFEPTVSQVKFDVRFMHGKGAGLALIKGSESSRAAT